MASLPPTKPRQTPNSHPDGDYTYTDDHPPPPPNCTKHEFTSRKHFPLITNIHDWLPFPLVYLAPPTAGYDFNPASNRYVRDCTRSPPWFPKPVFRCTLPQQAGIVDDVVFAMKASSPWVYQGERHNGSLHLPTGVLDALHGPNHSKTGPKRRHEWTQTYLCTSHGNPSSQVKPTKTDATRRSSGSNRVMCPAKFFIRKTLDGFYEFEWFWIHENHNPFSIEDMRNKRLPDVVDKWLTKKVVEGLRWPSIKILNRCKDLFPDEANPLGAVPEAFNISPQDVRNRIRKRAIAITKLAECPLASVEAWINRLSERGWHTYKDIRVTHKRVQIGFFSPWQRQQILKYGGDVICFDSTHKVCSPIEIPDWPQVKFTLITLVIRNPVTGSGTPVVWFLTSDEQAETITRFLTWLKNDFQVHPNAFMTDCAPAFKKAILNTYQHTIKPSKNYFCLFHVSRAIQAKASKLLPEQAARRMHMDAMEVIHAQRWQDRWQGFKRDYNTLCPTFVTYFEDQWASQADNCMLSERSVPLQGIHTNNFNESYHRVLKFNFLNPLSVLRIDGVIHILVEDVEVEYRQLALTTTLGFRKQRTSKFQNVAKGLADTYTDTELAYLGVIVWPHSSTLYTMGSFTRPRMLEYNLTVTPPSQGKVGTVNNCTCPHFAQHKSACKHMYVLARQLKHNICETALQQLDDGISRFAPLKLTTPIGDIVQLEREESSTSSSSHSSSYHEPRNMHHQHNSNQPIPISSDHSHTPSPPPVYRTTSGMTRTPSLIGLPDAAAKYAITRPAPYPPHWHSNPPGPAPSTSRAAGPSDVSDRYLPEPHVARHHRRTSHLYMDNLLHDPQALHSTPPLGFLNSPLPPPSPLATPHANESPFLPRAPIHLCSSSHSPAPSRTPSHRHTSGISTPRHHHITAITNSREIRIAGFTQRDRSESVHTTYTTNTALVNSSPSIHASHNSATAIPFPPANFSPIPQPPFREHLAAFHDANLNHTLTPSPPLPPPPPPPTQYQFQAPDPAMLNQRLSRLALPASSRDADRSRLPSFLASPTPVHASQLSELFDAFDAAAGHVNEPRDVANPLHQLDAVPQPFLTSNRVHQSAKQPIASSSTAPHPRDASKELKKMALTELNNYASLTHQLHKKFSSDDVITHGTLKAIERATDAVKAGYYEALALYGKDQNKRQRRG